MNPYQIMCLQMNFDTDTIWDELDFDFLGNRFGQPYIVQTNIYTYGKGNKEQRINLWFDPSLAFHS
jgi:xyloglucan:xyloglucosyl transferase